MKGIGHSGHLGIQIGAVIILIYFSLVLLGFTPNPFS